MSNQEIECHPFWNDYPVPDNLPPVIINDPTLPLVSIVTPSYNQGRFIRETIESVLNQDYPNIEYWVIDGGSTDETLSILQEYEHDPRFHWIGEKDDGQSDAINKGFCRCRGEIVAWLNSDDYYMIDALSYVATYFVQDKSLGMVYGDVQVVDKQSKYLQTRGAIVIQEFVIPIQPGCFFRKSAINKVGLINTSFHYVMDTDIILKLTSNFDYICIPTTLAAIRTYNETKTSAFSSNFASELIMVVNNILAHRDAYPRLMPLDEAKIKHNFYRLMSQYLYMGGEFGTSLYCLDRATRLCPYLIWDIAINEGYKWFLRRILTVGQYRFLSSGFRKK